MGKHTHPCFGGRCDGSPFIHIGRKANQAIPDVENVDANANSMLVVPAKKKTHSPLEEVDDVTAETCPRNQRERNNKLSRLNSELNQELQEVMEQRIALEIQLEHLKPFAS